jgi:hypothetical protein
MFTLSNLTRRQMMRQLLAGISTLSLLLLVFALPPGQAQVAPGATRAVGPLSYDLSQEVSLHGTVSAVLAQASFGMISGSHLLLTTLSGPVDISLGMFGLQGEGALVIAGGQQVEVVGVMKTLKDKRVLLARNVKVGDHLYTIRNEHGIPITPQARKRASQNPQNGETR